MSLSKALKIYICCWVWLKGNSPFPLAKWKRIWLIFMVCSRFTVQQENRVYVHIPDIYHECSSLHEQEKEMSKEMLKLEERRESSQETGSKQRCIALCFSGKFTSKRKVVNSDPENCQGLQILNCFCISLRLRLRYITWITEIILFISPEMTLETSKDPTRCPKKIFFVLARKHQFEF